MKKDDLLQKDIENVLIEINFVDLYKDIWIKYSQENTKFEISDDQVLSIFKELGYEVHKYNNSQFFTDWFCDKGFEYKIGISIKFNIIHFDFSVRSEKKGIKSGGDFGLLVQLITNWNMPIKSPSFNSFESFNCLIYDLINLFVKIKFKMESYFKLD